MVVGNGGLICRELLIIYMSSKTFLLQQAPLMVLPCSLVVRGQTIYREWLLESRTLAIVYHFDCRKGNSGHIANLFPAATITHIAGAGHWLHVENPKDFLLAVKRLLN